jgi:hypothetical protein
MPGQTYFARRMHRGLNEAYPGLKTFCGRTNRSGTKKAQTLKGLLFQVRENAAGIAAESRLL